MVCFDAAASKTAMSPSVRRRTMPSLSRDRAEASMPSTVICAPPAGMRISAVVLAGMAKLYCQDSSRSSDAALMGP